jgi:hypothetical protein
MPKVTDSRLTAKDAALVVALYNAKGEKSIGELAATFNPPKKEGSLTTAISNLRTKFKLAKKPFEYKGVSLEPRKMTGQGRAGAERIDLADMLDNLEGLASGDVDFDDIVSGEIETEAEAA